MARQFSVRAKILLVAGFVAVVGLGVFFLLNVAHVIVSAAVAHSHIQANVPERKFFDEYLKRDLQRYFCWEPEKDCRVEYELLRNGPTQTGLSYPKYYLWARCFKNDKLATEGAVRVETIEQDSFHVTHFLSGKEILASPDDVATIFPAALANKIIEKARHSVISPLHPND